MPLNLGRLTDAVGSDAHVGTEVQLVLATGVGRRIEAMAINEIGIVKVRAAAQHRPRNLRLRAESGNQRTPHSQLTPQFESTPRADFPVARRISIARELNSVGVSTSSSPGNSETQAAVHVHESEC
jgi:hypothetical protein